MDTWTKRCLDNWEDAAARLVARGWRRIDVYGLIVPSTFHKGDEAVYLSREISCSVWHVSPLYWSETLQRFVTVPPQERGEA